MDAQNSASVDRTIRTLGIYAVAQELGLPFLDEEIRMLQFAVKFTEDKELTFHVDGSSMVCTLIIDGDKSHCNVPISEFKKMMALLPPVPTYLPNGDGFRPAASVVGRV